MKMYVVSVLIGCGLVITAQAKKDPTSGIAVSPPAASASQPWLQVEISPLEKEIVRQHLADIHEAQSKKQTAAKASSPRGAQKGAKHETLTPGWQKKLIRGAVLPAAVYSQAQPLPEAVRRKLPPPPAGTVMVMLDNTLVRLLEATRTIVDVLELQ